MRVSGPHNLLSKKIPLDNSFEGQTKMQMITAIKGGKRY